MQIVQTLGPKVSIEMHTTNEEKWTKKFEDTLSTCMP